MSSGVEETDVLIVGGGPVGLALAVELGSRGIKALLIEKADRVGRNPRAKTTNVRTMEHMRRWGLAKQVRDASPLPPDYARNAVFATRLFGHPIVTIENVQYMNPVGEERFSEPAQWIPQYKVEEVLRARAASLPSITLSFATELVGATQSAMHVEATLAESTNLQPRKVCARYLVGADGARSSVREMIGASMTGDHAFANFLGMILKLPGIAHPQGDGIMYWLLNPDCPATMGPMDVGDLWFWGAPVPPGFKADEAEARRKVIASLGKEIPFEIVSMDPWQAHRLIADRYRKDRMFLIGDACHLHPPFGGYGMNMGIGDSIDLGWKLTAVLQGWGGERLLESYECERRPVHRRIIDEAVENLSFFGHYFKSGKLEEASAEGTAARTAMAADVVKAKTREFRALGMVLGAHYAGSPVIVADGTSAPPFDAIDYLPTASPGGRAPHLWLTEGQSLYDLFGDGFTLLITDGSKSTEAASTAVTLAAKRNIPLTVTAPGHPALAGLYDAKFALIRPDQHVAWRGDVIEDSFSEVLDAVCGA